MIVMDLKEPGDYTKFADRTDDLKIDFLVEGQYRKYAGERKTISDLIASVRDGRLWNQLDTLCSMKEAGYIPILVLEGQTWLFFKKKVLTLGQWLGIQMAIASFCVPSVHVSGKSQYAFLLRMLDERAGKAREYVRPTIPKPKERTIYDERVDMLAAVNGIGIKSAESLIDKYGTIRAVCGVEMQDLVELLGEKRAAHLLTVLG